MEAARCQICGKPMSSWLEVCGELCVCMNCAATVTLSDLSGAGFAKVKPDTYQMDGETLVTKDSPDEILNYQDAKQKLSTMYGMKVETVIPYSDAVEAFKSKEQLNAEYGKVAHVKATKDVMPNLLEESYNWEMPEIVERIHKIGFATEAAFFAHCNTLRESDYTPAISYALILQDRYCERCVVDEIGTTCNYLEGQTPDEAIGNMLAAEKEWEAAHPEYQESLVTKETPDVLPVYNSDGTEVA